MKKRIASLLLTLALCGGLTVPALADIEENDSQFTDSYMYIGDGVNRIPLDESASGIGWSYDADTHTITFDGYKGILMANKVGGVLTIDLAEGSTNTITTGSSVDNALVTGDTETGSLVIQGSGTLIIDGSANISMPVIVKSGTVQIIGGTIYYGITLNGGYAGNGAALHVEGGSVTVKNGISKGYSMDVDPVTVTGGELIIGEKSSQILELIVSSTTGLETANAVDQNGNPLTLKKVDHYFGYFDSTGAPATYAKITAAGSTEPVQPAPALSFDDVPAGAYYSAPVAWAVEKGITNGTSDTTFSPDATCTRAQIITFLWRAAGSPEPNSINAFTDVQSDTYYAKAAAWAAENGMAGGSTFSPDAPCTRETAVEFMWKHAGSPDAAAAVFTDVSSAAVNWAVEKGVTNGTSDTTFSPDATCTRGQIVTFLYRGFAK